MKSFEKLILFVVVVFIFFLPVVAFCQGTAVVGGSFITDFVLEQALKNPWIFTILAVVGVARMVLKPLMSFFHTYVKATKSLKDDKLYNKISNSKIYKGIIWVLDYLFSIKLIGNKK